MHASFFMANPNDARGERASMHSLARLMALLGSDEPEEAKQETREHKFWKTQPVMQHGETEDDMLGPIQPAVPPENVRGEPYPLPADFEWVTVDIEEPEDLNELYTLLTHNYVEDDDATMRFKYSAEFLHWVLRHPGYDKSWYVGVRVKATKKLVAFIAGIPQELRVRETVCQSTEINFLCVHKKLRSKRLAPVMIKEVTRRCNVKGIFQAIYTVGSVLPTPASCSRYYHRTLRAEKLLDIGFSAVPEGMSREVHIARYTLPDLTTLEGLREMRAADVGQVATLLRRYLARYDMAPQYTDEEVAHLLLSGRGDEVDGRRTKQVTWTYVVEQDGRITDFFSFYSLPSSILDHAEADTLEAAYLFYYATDVVLEAKPPSAATSGVSPYAAAIAQGKPAWQCGGLSRLYAAEMQDTCATPWHQEPLELREKLKARLQELMHDMLILAKNQGFDVVNCLTVMDNPLFATELKFGPGDGFLRFYLFNWRVRPIAGGMGIRAGEQALDPAAQDGPPPPPLQYGSGNGVVMV
ncbi:glycylpeptide N-tetradecanoyltransferase [Malassezia vespertilionis]|uniref:Glycylpeptide N-tetradecanoyltransferase n=1 Tax=Malassezia vespertilionis TaxID=2020962 RepID=A0A2N1J7P8_9BASI|nr:glycylpeptide N-tetradecanoyltransferase [Malassezia vespertilionis]PKI82570.1 Nmt1p [Malassezia vespertilionis]WFD08497.1 glycylpeptide N-tetradecanoyltransferase [Malassezia vespertilionis]